MKPTKNNESKQEKNNNQAPQSKPQAKNQTGLPKLVNIRETIHDTIKDLKNRNSTAKGAVKTFFNSSKLVQ